MVSRLQRIWPLNPRAMMDNKIRINVIYTTIVNMSMSNLKNHNSSEEDNECQIWEKHGIIECSHVVSGLLNKK
jgi:hypothetical protein